MKKLIRSLALTAGIAASATASAQLAGHNVVLVHGFQPHNLFSPPTPEQVIQNGEAYWADFWNQHAEARIDWSSADTLEGGIAISVANQLAEISRSGLCQNGCVLVTHSTGDLVTRYMLENQDYWMSAQGLQPVNFIVSIDFAGAGGGTELADLAVGLANSDNWLTQAMKDAVEYWLGFTYTTENLGVLNNLQVAAARNTATLPSPVPRLRFVGTGDQYYGVTSPFIAGKDDSVVPLASACGAGSADAIDSCSNQLAADGAIVSQNGPASLLYNHYPVLMGYKTHHGGTIGAQVDGWMAFVENYFVAGIPVNMNTTVDSRWYWMYDYQYVVGSDTRSMSETVYTELN